MVLGNNSWKLVSWLYSLSLYLWMWCMCVWMLYMNDMWMCLCLYMWNMWTSVHMFVWMWCAHGVWMCSTRDVCMCVHKCVGVLLHNSLSHPSDSESFNEPGAWQAASLPILEGFLSPLASCVHCVLALPQNQSYSCRWPHTVSEVSVKVFMTVQQTLSPAESSLQLWLNKTVWQELKKWLGSWGNVLLLQQAQDVHWIAKEYLLVLTNLCFRIYSKSRAGVCKDSAVTA